MAVNGNGDLPGKTIADELWMAIAEGRRLDAMDIVQRIFPTETFTNLHSLHRLFPDRVAAPTSKDRA